jgi:hypothetical protein
LAKAKIEPTNKIERNSPSGTKSKETVELVSIANRNKLITEAEK